MPPTDGFDELALIRFRGECGWSSSTATSASRPSRIGADRRSAMRCVSNVRALCRAAPKTAIAKLTGVSRTALYSFMASRGLRPSP